MRSTICVLLLVLSSAVMADDMADAEKALATKAYPQALQLFGKLAAAGNPEAQLRLGEMYWYGEGVALDRAKGDALFAQAAASGNPEAVAARTLSAQRALHGAAIAYWTGGYDGADLTAGKYNCAAPAIPAVSKTETEIRTTNAAVVEWRRCYNEFAANLNASLPPGKRIPAEVVVVMSEPETQQARAHVEKVYGTVLGKAQADAAAVTARHAAWLSATTDAVEAHNRVIEARTRQTKIDLDIIERARQDTRWGVPTENGGARPVGRK